MQIRFACLAEDDDDFDFDFSGVGKPVPDCRWCGFSCPTDNFLYQEDEAVDTPACVFCHGARNVTPDLLERRGSLIWMPEIGQDDISDVVRACMVAKHAFPDDLDVEESSTSSVYSRPSASTSVRRLMKRLRRGRDSLNGILTAHGIEDLQDEWGDLPAETRELFLRGLRYLPANVEAARIRRWLDDESSLNGFGFELVEKQKWFREDLGNLVPPPTRTVRPRIAT